MKRGKGTWKPRSRLRIALRRSGAPWWIATAVLGLLTATVVNNAVGTATRAAAAWGSEREVWVVQRAVDAGDVIAAAAVRRTRVPRGVVPDGALDGATSPIGEATRVALARGEVVLTKRLAGRGAHGVAAMVAPGYRAVALPYDDQMPALNVGDRIDVLATFDLEAEEGAPSFPVATNAEVLMVSDRAVTIAVDADDAARVAFALSRGAIAVALRGGTVEKSRPLYD
jgi:Flp pilus assembly protein CpaB